MVTGIAPIQRRRSVEAYPTRANLYPLTLSPEPTRLFLVRERVGGREHHDIFLDEIVGATVVEPTPFNMRRAIRRLALAALEEAGFKVSSQFPLVVDTSRNLAPPQTTLTIHPAFDLRVLSFGTNYYLCLNHRLIVRVPLKLAQIADLDSTFQLQPSQRALVRTQGRWEFARFTTIGTETCELVLTGGGEIEVAPDEIVPQLTYPQILRLAPHLGIEAGDLERKLKQLALLTVAKAPLARFDVCTEFAQKVADLAFPFTEGATVLSVDPEPAVLRPPRFVLVDNIQEAELSFDHVDQTKRARNIVEGLVQFGTYEKHVGSIRLLLVSTQDRLSAMELLVKRLNDGSARYPGAEKTFGGKFTIAEALTGSTVKDYGDLLRAFTRQRNRADIDVALVYLPRQSDVNDYSHPYYQIKGYLVKEGIASQMVDEATVRDLTWRDLNLALNISAKSGKAPWVLDEALPGVDLFIGLSWSQVVRNGFIIRMMAYVNVFDSYGRWQFYQGDTLAFSFEDRLNYYGDLVKNSVAAYKAENGGKIGSIHVHLTKRFSYEERQTISQAVREVEPDASVMFVWINRFHALRLYNLADDADGKIKRSTFLVDEPSEGEPGRAYLSTTGLNVFREKGMGTPIPLELTVWSDSEDSTASLRDVGQQVLSLTRLNWASSRSFCHEPITTKFAGDIARLMSAFMQDTAFSVNPALRSKPWFL